MDFVMKVVYRQTFNMVSGRWVIPKKKAGKTWTPIQNVACVTSKKWGYAGAILRMKRVFDLRRDKEGNRVWKTKTFTKPYPVKNPKYLITYLVCEKLSYGFSKSL